MQNNTESIGIVFFHERINRFLNRIIRKDTTRFEFMKNNCFSRTVFFAMNQRRQYHHSAKPKFTIELLRTHHKTIRRTNIVPPQSSKTFKRITL